MLVKKYNNALWFDPTSNELKVIYESLENSNLIVNNKRSCYIFVYGKQKRNIFNKISTIEGLEVISVKFYGSNILKFFSFLISGYSALIKLNTSKPIRKVMEILSKLSMVGIFSFDSKYENQFIEYYNNNTYRSYYPEEFIKKDASYFNLIIDGDNTETKSGMLAIISYGVKCPKKLQLIFNNFGKYGYIGENQL